METCMRTAALVLETNNLEGGAASRAQVERTLERTLSRLRSQVDRVVDRALEIVVTHFGLDADAQKRLDPEGRVRFVELEPGTGYYRAKRIGAEATRTKIVVFADADCDPQPGWLAAILGPFADPEIEAVAGRTTYGPGPLGAAATTIDFLYFDSPRKKGATLNFYANNIALSRRVIEAHPFTEGGDLYRGDCQRLGARLYQAGIDVRYAHDAHTVHRFPDSVAELIALRLHRGRDLRRLAPALAEAHLPKLVEPSPPMAAALVYAGRAIASQLAVEPQGMVVRGPQRWWARGLIVGITALDGVGALGLAADPKATLSYHRDRH
jgi:cellulose synthase/poly-beta-1,6-N-acetylglucosamine synthase-like glycosyltransferase